MNPIDVLHQSDINTAAITAGATVAARWPGRWRVRMTDEQIGRYGAANSLRIVNKSNKRLRIHFTWSIDAQRFEDVEANAVRNIGVDDGYRIYGFDIENLDTLNDIAAGEVQYLLQKVNK